MEKCALVRTCVHIWTIIKKKTRFEQYLSMYFSTDIWVYSRDRVFCIIHSRKKNVEPKRINPNITLASWPRYGDNQIKWFSMFLNGDTQRKKKTILLTTKNALMTKTRLYLFIVFEKKKKRCVWRIHTSKSTEIVSKRKKERINKWIM